MPGPKHKKGRRNNMKQKGREMIHPGENQMYAVALKRLGSGGSSNAKIALKCYDGKERKGTVKGSMKKRNWINAENVVIIQLGTHDDDQFCEIIHKYQPAEVHQLMKLRPNPLEFYNFSKNSEEDDFVVEEDDDDSEKKEYVSKQPSREFPPSDSDSEEESDQESDQDRKTDRFGNFIE